MSVANAEDPGRASGRPMVAGRTNATKSETAWTYSKQVQEWEDPALQVRSVQPAYM